MKIIHRGCIPDNRIWEGTCMLCNSLIEAEQHELKNIVHDQQNGSFNMSQPY